MRMLTLVILVGLTMNACYNPQSVCIGADLFTDDLCIFTNGHKVDVEDIDYMVQIVKEEMIKYDSTITMDQLDQVFVDYEVSLTFIDKGKDLWVNGKRARGLCSFDKTNYVVQLVVHYESYCLNFGSLAHELLHLFLIPVKDIDYHALGWLPVGPLSDLVPASNCVQYKIHQRFFEEACDSYDYYMSLREGA